MLFLSLKVSRKYLKMAEINLYFPTAIYTETNLFSEEENIQWIDRILELQDTVPSGGEGWEGRTYTTHSKYDLIQDPLFSPLIEKVQLHVNEFTSAHGSNLLHTCNGAWANINIPNTYQEYHVHPSSVFSCVYYPKVPEGSGSIVFENPTLPDMMPVLNIKERNDLSFERVAYTPEAGTLLIFRSFIRHCVREGTNTEPRISIALNFG